MKNRMNDVRVIIPKTIHKQLQKLGVADIYLFGSHAEGRAGRLSDVDIGIRMKDQRTVGESISTHELYQKLYELLEPILKRHAKEMDIIFLQRASLELQAHVVRYGKVLYETDAVARLDYEEKTMLLFADFEPIRRRFDHAILERV